jgi:hypothetical protein
MSGRLKLLAGAALAFGILIGVTPSGQSPIRTRWPKSDVAELSEITAVHSFWHVDLLGDAVFDLLPLKSTWNLGEE